MFRCDRRAGVRIVTVAAMGLAGLTVGCDRRSAAAGGPIHDVVVTVKHAGGAECSSVPGVSGKTEASANSSRNRSGTIVCGPSGSVSMTQWSWVAVADGADEYAFTRRDVKAEGEAGASLEQTGSGPMWLGPKQTRTVRFRGESVVVFENERERVLMRAVNPSGGE